MVPPVLDPVELEDAPVVEPPLLVAPPVLVPVDEALLLAEAVQIRARRMFIDAMPPLSANGHNGSNGQNGVDAREMFHTLVQGLHRENLTAMLAV